MSTSCMTSIAAGLSSVTRRGGGRCVPIAFRGIGWTRRGRHRFEPACAPVAAAAAVLASLLLSGCGSGLAGEGGSQRGNPSDEKSRITAGTYSGSVHQRIIVCTPELGCQNRSDSSESQSMRIGGDGLPVDGSGRRIQRGSTSTTQYGDFTVRAVVTRVTEPGDTVVIISDVSTTADDGTELTGTSTLALNASDERTLEFSFEAALSADETMENSVRIVRVGTLSR